MEQFCYSCGVPLNMPDRVKYALYRSENERTKRNREWFKSYIFYTDTPWPDSKHGVQFFYHPDYKYKFGFQHPLFSLFFGPSFLGLGIALFTSISRIRIWKVMALLVLAVVLHGVTSLIYLAGVQYGEVWYGYSSQHNALYFFFFAGILSPPFRSF